MCFMNAGTSVMCIMKSSRITAVHATRAWHSRGRCLVSPRIEERTLAVIMTKAHYQAKVQQRLRTVHIKEGSAVSTLGTLVSDATEHDHLYVYSSKWSHTYLRHVALLVYLDPRCTWFTYCA